MLDRSNLPLSFAVNFNTTPYDLDVTAASNEARLVLNVSRPLAANRLRFPSAISIDRHDGTVTYSPELLGDFERQQSRFRPLLKAPIYLYKIPALLFRILSAFMPQTVFLGGSAALVANVLALGLIAFLLMTALYVFVFVAAPILVLLLICWGVNAFYVQPKDKRALEKFLADLVPNVAHLVEQTALK